MHPADYIAQTGSTWVAVSNIGGRVSRRIRAAIANDIIAPFAALDWGGINCVIQ